jgi:hypothetical protein
MYAPTYITHTYSLSFYLPLSDLHTLRSGSFKREQMLYYHFFNTHQIFPGRKERPMRQGGGRILLGNNTGGGVVMLWLIRFLHVEVWISTGLPYIYTYTCILNSDLCWTFLNVIGMFGCVWTHIHSVISSTMYSNVRQERLLKHQSLYV